MVAALQLELEPEVARQLIALLEVCVLIAAGCSPAGGDLLQLRVQLPLAKQMSRDEERFDALVDFEQPDGAFTSEGRHGFQSFYLDALWLVAAVVSAIVKLDIRTEVWALVVSWGGSWGGFQCMSASPEQSKRPSHPTPFPLR